MNNPKKNTSTNVIVEKLLLIFEERKLTQYQLSEMSDVPYSTIKSIFQRKTKTITIDNIIKISESLGFNVWDFVKDKRLTREYLDI